MGKDTFGGEFGARYCNQWGLYGIHVRQCRACATVPRFSQITLGRLVKYSVQILFLA